MNTPTTEYVPDPELLGVLESLIRVENQLVKDEQYLEAQMSELNRSQARAVTFSLGNRKKLERTNAEMKTALDRHAAALCKTRNWLTAQNDALEKAIGPTAETITKSAWLLLSAARHLITAEQAAAVKRALAEDMELRVNASPARRYYACKKPGGFFVEVERAIMTAIPAGKFTMGAAGFEDEKISKK